ncbi:MAG: hypothetical protein ACRD8O_09780 [Bryobacteraceae bacterium]
MRRLIDKMSGWVAQVLHSAKVDFSGATQPFNRAFAPLGFKSPWSAGNLGDETRRANSARSSQRQD